MSTCDKYITYKKRRRLTGTTTWEDVTPATYSLDGDGTKTPIVVVEEDTTNCCPPTSSTRPAGTTEWRVVNGQYNCSGTSKVQRQQQYQWNGTAWVGLQNFRNGSLIEENSTDCGYVPPTQYDAQYFTIIPTEAGIIAFDGDEHVSYNQLSYSLNSGSTWSSPSSAISINASANQKIMFKGECQGDTVQSNYYGMGTFGNSHPPFKVEGNIMSLVFGDNFQGQTSLAGKGSVFIGLFDSSTVTDASNLVLPATYLTAHCYEKLFLDCSALTLVPQLPAMEVGIASYLSMFEGCISLVTAPSLPATSVLSYGYEKMFGRCSTLRVAPQLQATQLNMYSYAGMFSGCTSLTTPPQLPATNLAEGSYREMFRGCTSLTTAPSLAAPAPSAYAYRRMFYGCTSLRQVTCLATTLTNSYAFDDWLYNVASSGTFVKASSATWPSGTSGIPSGWTTINAS